MLLSLLFLPVFLILSEPSEARFSCSSFATQGYDCVPYYLCKDGYIVTDGEGVIDPRGLLTRRRQTEEERIANWKPEDASCPVIFEVCCKDAAFSVPTLTSTTAPTQDLVICKALRPDPTVGGCLTLSQLNPLQRYHFCVFLLDPSPKVHKFAHWFLQIRSSAEFFPQIEWCEANCLHVPSYCPQDFCRCSSDGVYID